MKHTVHIIDVFSSAPLGSAQVAVLPDAAGISTEGTEGVSMGRGSETEAEARKRDGVVTSVGVGGAIGMGSGQARRRRLHETGCLKHTRR